jgi:hypothetical protein
MSTDLELRILVLTSEKAQQVPELRSIHFIQDSPCLVWPEILRDLIPTDSTAAIFPDLQEVVILARDFDYKLEFTDEHHKLLRDFGLARGGVLTRLSIPYTENMGVLTSLQDHIPNFEVHILTLYSLRSLIMLIRCRNLIIPLTLLFYSKVMTYDMALHLSSTEEE